MLHPIIEKYVMEKALLARLLEEKRQAMAHAQAQAIKKAARKQKVKSQRKTKKETGIDF